MKNIKLALFAMFGFALLIGLPIVAGPAFDPDDEDGIPPGLDNCPLVTNGGAQFCDSDVDGYGNMCDGDFNQDFLVTSTDFTKRFIPELMSGTPGPSGLACAGTPGCM